MTSACSEWKHINTPGSQQHLTNLVNYLWGHFYRTFLLFRRRGSREREKDRGTSWRDMGTQSLLSFTYITSRLLSQSPIEEAPVSLSRSSPSTPLSWFFHPSIAVAPQPRPPRITPQAGVLSQNFPHSLRREKCNERKVTRRPTWPLHRKGKT